METTAVPHDEHERTIPFAEIALEQIRALHQPATPRNYEVWYHYATGYDAVFNQAINDALAKKGVLSDADLERLYDTHIAKSRAGERVEAVGSRVLDEIKQVLDMVNAAAGSATTYSESLADATEQLESAKDGETLRAVIGALVEGAREMEANNKKLEARLSASRQEIEQLQQNLEVVRSESLTDPLTTLSNRKLFDVALARCIAEALERHEPLSLLMADIDHFKKFNDQYGHLTGDQVLRLVALSVKQNVRGRDVAARYGGEEFVIVLPNTALQPAITVADHIRRAVMTKELVRRSTGERLGRVTISVGVAALHPTDSAQLVIDRADKCLYAAKRNGRNRVICEADPEADAAAKVA